MKMTIIPTKLSEFAGLRRLSAVLVASALAATSALADSVYVTATTANCTDPTDTACQLNQDVNINSGLVYNENGMGGFTSAAALSPGKPPTAGARYFSTYFTNSSTPDFGIIISPTLGVTGGVYRVYHTFASWAGNVSTNVVLAVTNTAGCTLSFTNGIDKFQSVYGNATNGLNSWQFLGYLTNNPDTSTPAITFYWESGDVDAGADKRLLIDTFLFVCDPCTAVAQVGISGVYAVGGTNVVVTGVNGTATAIKVYQYNPSTLSWSLVGQRTSGIVAGNNNVAVTGLVKGGQLAATQTVGGQEGCNWGVPTGVVVGTPNPRVRLALSLRETTSTGPAGAIGLTSGFTASANLFFLGVTNRLSSAPGYPGKVIFPSNSVWQAVTFDAGMQSVGNSANVVGTALAGSGYNANDSVAIQVYAYRTVPANGVLVYSQTAAQSSAVTSNAVFAVSWSWNAVSGADGYRLLRNVNGGGYNDYVDVVAATTMSDGNNAWSPGNTVTPTVTQTGYSVKWNAATGYDPAGTVSGMSSNWYTIDSFAFVIDDLTSVGPHDIYIDTIQNGATVFYNMEPAPAGTTDYALRAPDFSGSTSANLAGTPDSSVIVNNASYEGTKSMRVQWAWNSTVNTKWLRLTTSGVGNPQVNVTDPITIRFLYVPDGGTYPKPPPAPTLSAGRVNGQTVLNWVGGHRLQTSVNVPGTYTNVPQVLSANTYTNIILGGFLAPWTNNFPEPMRFFRLMD